MTIDALIAESGLPRIEAEVLAAAVLKRDRTWVLAHGAEELPETQRATVARSFDRRSKGEPVAYITGEREFFGRTFSVTPAVLIPRPATEELVRSALAFLDHPVTQRREADAGIVIAARVLRPEARPRIVVDVGTGSGCIAITLALERPGLRLVATDVSTAALEVARRNAERFGVSDRMEFRNGEVLAPVRDLAEPFLLVSNPPYIPAGRVLQREVMEYEPQQALFAGNEGMDVLRSLLREATEHPFCAGYVFECGQEQADLLLKDHRN